MTHAGTINFKLISLRHFVVVCLHKIPWHYWENTAFLPWTERTTNLQKAVDVGWREQCCSSVGFHSWMEPLVNAIRSICYDIEEYMKSVFWQEKHLVSLLTLCWDEKSQDVLLVPGSWPSQYLSHILHMILEFLMRS